MRPTKLFLSILISSLFISTHSYTQQYGWQVIARPTTVGLSSVVFTDTLRGVIGRGSAGFYVTTDGGSTWVPGTGATFSVQSISMFDHDRGWAAGNSGSFARINHTTNGGLSWVDQRSVLDHQYTSTASLTALKNITVGGKSSGPDTGLIVRTTNGGTTWLEQRFPGSSLRKVCFVDSLHGWALKDSFHLSDSYGFVLRTSDGGVNWSQHPSPTLFGQSVRFGAMTFLDRNRGWGALGQVSYGSTDGGLSWDSLYTITTGDGFAASDLCFTDSLYGWAFGDAFYQGIISEAIYHTTDGGHSWYRESIGLTGDLGTLDDGIMLDRTHGWAVAEDGRVLAYKRFTSVAERLPGQPLGFDLRQNYPNPFNPDTFIEYSIVERSEVVINVFDDLGKEIRTIINTTEDPGVYRVKFDGTGLASGTYFYQLTVGHYHQTRQMILLK